MTRSLTQTVQFVSEQMANEGKALPTPPDHDDEGLDAEFWSRVSEQLVLAGDDAD